MVVAIDGSFGESRSDDQGGAGRPAHHQVCRPMQAWRTVRCRACSDSSAGM